SGALRPVALATTLERPAALSMGTVACFRTGRHLAAALTPALVVAATALTVEAGRTPPEDGFGFFGRGLGLRSRDRRLGGDRRDVSLGGSAGSSLVGWRLGAFFRLRGGAGGRVGRVARNLLRDRRRHLPLKRGGDNGRFNGACLFRGRRPGRRFHRSSLVGRGRVDGARAICLLALRGGDDRVASVGFRRCLSFGRRG